MSAVTAEPESHASRRIGLRLLKSSTFRLALLYMGLFSVSVVALLGFIYWSTAGYMIRQTEATIEAEIEALAERYRSTSLQGLVRLIRERLERDPTAGPVYLLTDAQYRPLIGNLDRWPSADVARETNRQGWVRLEIEGSADNGEAEPARALARVFVLPGGLHLLAGRDVRELESTRTLIGRTLGWGLGLTVLLALAGGVAMSRGSARRIETIRQTGQEIIDGDLSRRIPRDHTGDDFDQLAAHLNHMLDRIEILMSGVREVSDNIAHDLRTPLARLRGQLEQLRSEPDSARSQVETAIAEADALLATFNGLLRIARVESGARAEFGVIDLQQVVQDVAELYAPLAEHRRQQFEVISEDSPGRIQGDRHLLFQSLANLLDNAIKYTPAAGKIQIALAQDECEGVAQVTVTDTGPGIAPTYRNRVFARFFRLEQHRGSPGNGLGLSLVAAVARLHQATVSLGGDDQGLAVQMKFPLAATRQ